MRETLPVRQPLDYPLIVIKLNSTVRLHPLSLLSGFTNQTIRPISSASRIGCWRFLGSFTLHIISPTSHITVFQSTCATSSKTTTSTRHAPIPVSTSTRLSWTVAHKAPAPERLMNDSSSRETSVSIAKGRYHCESEVKAGQGSTSFIVAWGWLPPLTATIPHTI